MKTISKIIDLQQELKPVQAGQIGLAPTMGHLHAGHLSLVQKSKSENDLTMVSIFVNPTQFSPGEDFIGYPRDLKRDEQLLADLGVDIIFYPDVSEMYPEKFLTNVEVSGWSSRLCGRSRPHHFKGVTTVVLKLFNIINPTRAYFGQKDAQQVIIIKKMVRDLNVSTRISVLPIVRDHDGLALSSRNVYLSKEERKAALHLPKALSVARESIREGSNNECQQLINQIKRELNKNSLIEIDYVDCISLDTLEPIKQVLPGNTLVAAAIRIGKTRLIDNFTLGEI